KDRDADVRLALIGEGALGNEWVRCIHFQRWRTSASVSEVLFISCFSPRGFPSKKPEAKIYQINSPADWRSACEDARPALRISPGSAPPDETLHRGAGSFETGQSWRKRVKAKRHRQLPRCARLQRLLLTTTPRARKE